MTTCKSTAQLPVSHSKWKTLHPAECKKDPSQEYHKFRNRGKREKTNPRTGKTSMWTKNRMRPEQKRKTDSGREYHADRFEASCGGGGSERTSA
jgi:hypothetical protein